MKYNLFKQGYILIHKHHTANSNTAVGANSLDANTTGADLCAVGSNALGQKCIHVLRPCHNLDVEVQYSRGPGAPLLMQVRSIKQAPTTPNTC